LKINFILNTIGLCGGPRVVLEYANHLQNRGHKVSIVYPESKPKGLKRILRRNVGNVLRATRILEQRNPLPWFNLKARLVRVPDLSMESEVPDADVSVATWWETAYNVAHYAKNKGTKFYLIQHYEVWGGQKEKVDDTYRLGLHNIVISTWLKSTIEGLNAKVERVISNGIDFKMFYPEQISKNKNEFRVLMPYRKVQWKGARDGFNAIELVRNTEPIVKLVAFGVEQPQPEELEKMEYHLKPSDNELRRLYCGSDALLFPSWVEGFGLPPLEAMACKTPVVTTNVGAVSDYAVPSVTALVCEPKNPRVLAKNLLTLIRDESKRRNMAEHAYNHVQQFTWDRAADSLERFLLQNTP